MSWVQWHQRSEQFALAAEDAARRNDGAAASSLYAQAAEAESQALQFLDRSKLRTLAVTAVSAASLWFKARQFQKAEQLAYLMLSNADLPEFATEQLRTLVQAIWTENSKQTAGVTFLPGQVYVSVKGGEVVTGGAPLDLIVDKVQTIQAIFYRTIEEAQEMPLRKRGGPVREIQEACRPWLFQAPPGSYQFSVAIQEPAQKDFFKERLDPTKIADRFLEVLRASGSDDPTQLEALVPDEAYRATFLKLVRNLAPSGKSFERLEVRSALDFNPVSLVPENRRLINSSLKSITKKQSADAPQTEKVLSGTLRAVDLNRDWIEISMETKTVRVRGLADTLDDVIGPMVNRKVHVRATESLPDVFQFEDIELDE